MNAVAIVGVACCYPDARSAGELWENVLAQRQSFRRLPPERLRLEDYWSEDPEAPDRVYSCDAALIQGYEFNRSRFRVSGNTFRSADLAHWLALDVASQALENAGFAWGEGLPRETTGVFLGNTLTGEFSRANALRLRWPYVKRIVNATLADEKWSPERRQCFSNRLEAAFKSPFPAIGEESLAGGLSNTIAGRICNHFNLQGGGYTVDGACSSSLLAVSNGCSALIAGDLDVALVGGVDLSLDPFELVGFAKTGALARGTMRVYDRRSNGFWPGEGCGFVLLMRHEDAQARGLRIYAAIKGWGISSDGSGGITRPEMEGQLLAFRRAYSRAGFGIETVALFEGHGTGTAVGDTVELQSLSHACRESGHARAPAAIGSVKANIGHTKAAAGIAGLIKTIFALDSEIIPPTTGCEDPHSELCGKSAVLRIARKAESWPRELPLRAGVSSMGFGGINAHVVLEADKPTRRSLLSYRERSLISSAQDAELFLFGAPSTAELLRQVDRVAGFVAQLSHAELCDLAAHLENNLSHCKVRAAVVASTPAGLAEALKRLSSVISRNEKTLDSQFGIYFAPAEINPRIGFLFPGQGSPSHLDGGALRRRFEVVEDVYAQAQLKNVDDEAATEIAQPAIATASLGALRVLNELGITAKVAVGHSLGELTALCWAGALDEAALLRIAGVRGQAMMHSNGVSGGMASLGAGFDEVKSLLNGHGVAIAAINSPLQTVISGETIAVDEVIGRARLKNIKAVKLPVSHAFHSPLVASAAPALVPYLANEQFQPLQRCVISTVTGRPLSHDANLSKLLELQITSPVRFMDAVTSSAAENIDLWIEVGPGQVLHGIMNGITEIPVISIDAGSESLRGLLAATAAAFALGQPVNHKALFAGRVTRPFDLDWHPSFFSNPCELAPFENAMEQAPNGEPPAKDLQPDFESQASFTKASPLELLTQLIAERAELPLSTIRPESSFLSDLHLNSISVSQLVGEAARRLHLPRPLSPTDFADATVAQAALALEEQTRHGPTVGEVQSEPFPAGVDSWVRPFCMELVERPLQNPTAASLADNHFDAHAGWKVLAPRDHPLAESLNRRMARESGRGVIVCLSSQPGEEIVAPLLKAARVVLTQKTNTKFVLVQQDHGAAAFARTLHLEAPGVTTCVVSVPNFDQRAADWVIAEALAADGHIEAHYDREGRRYEPAARLVTHVDDAGDLPLSPADVLLVSGGGKGITAECVFALAKESGARLVLLGRADPENDAELSMNLKRFRAAGIEFCFFSVDVTDALKVRDAVEKAQQQLGPITGILHGAARNEPRLLADLDEESFRRTLAVKVQGARNLLAAIDPEKLRLLITFSSIIARTGLRGEADYGLANEWLTQLTVDWQKSHPSCRCLAVEWSIWSGKGMGGRLGDTDRLMRQGITPISPDQGVNMLRKLLVQPVVMPVAVVVMSRFSDLPTFKLERPELPFLRFLEQPKVYYPGIELIVDVDLSTVNDPYLNDHVLKKERILPAVIGLEAMAQVAAAVTGSAKLPVFEKVKFNQPVVVQETGSLKIRLAALVRDERQVDVVLRCEETAFQVDHFQATCCFETEPVAEHCNTLGSEVSEPVALDPARDLYGGILFQRGRFQRLSNYRLLKATECVAEIVPDGSAAWFSQYLPSTLLLGDAGARDAMLHAVQACIPHRTILPISVDQLSFAQTSPPARIFVHARERSCDSNTLVYDLCARDANGNLREQWRGLRLKAVGANSLDGPWVEALLGPYVQRRVQEMIPGAATSVVLVRSLEDDRQSRSNRAIQIALDQQVEILRRPDGKPEFEGVHAVSASHVGDLTLAVAGAGPLACDIEAVVERSDSAWLDLLGEDRQSLVRLISQNVNEESQASATRVWAALECLKKAGAAVDAPLTIREGPTGACVCMASGRFTIVTFIVSVRDIEHKVVIAVLAAAQSTGLQDVTGFIC